MNKLLKNYDKNIFNSVRDIKNHLRDKEAGKTIQRLKNEIEKECDNDNQREEITTIDDYQKILKDQAPKDINSIKEKISKENLNHIKKSTIPVPDDTKRVMWETYYKRLKEEKNAMEDLIREYKDAFKNNDTLKDITNFENKQSVREYVRSLVNELKDANKKKDLQEKLEARELTTLRRDIGKNARTNFCQKMGTNRHYSIREMSHKGTCGTHCASSGISSSISQKQASEICG